MMMQRLLHVAALAAAALTLPAATAQSVVNADERTCAELVRMVNEAGTLRIYARYHNPNGSENYSERDFTARGARCPFFDERPSQWRIYAKSGEICEDLNICMPRSFGR